MCEVYSLVSGDLTESIDFHKYSQDFENGNSLNKPKDFKVLKMIKPINMENAVDIVNYSNFNKKERDVPLTIYDLQSCRDRYLEYCTFNRKLGPSTIKGYGHNLDNFVLFLGKLDPPVLGWTQVKRKHLDNYLDDVCENYSVSTIKGKFSSLRGFFYFLHDDGVEIDNPFRRFRLRMQKPVSNPISLTLGEVRSILKEAYKIENPSAFQKTRDILVLELLFLSGMRVSELCGIKLSDYNPVEKTIEVIGKGSRNRLVFISNEEVISLLNNYLYLRENLLIENSNQLLCNNLFLSNKMLPLKTDHVREIVRKYKNAAGMTKRVTPHTFRHTFASLLLEEGVDIKYIQELLGHSSIKTTQIYLHTTNVRKREILAKMHPRRKLGAK